MALPAKSSVPLPAMFRVDGVEALARRSVQEPVEARRMVAPSSVSVPRASSVPPFPICTRPASVPLPSRDSVTFCM